VIGAFELLCLILIPLAAYAYVGAHARQRALKRLDAAIAGAGADTRGDAAGTRAASERIRAAPQVFPRRYRWLPIVTGVATVAAFNLVLRLRWDVSAAIAFLCGVCAWLGEEYLAQRRTALIETQLSEAIDMLVASLRVGAALLVAFESALQESRLPLRSYLQDMVGRVRLGDDPRLVIAELPDRVPLETFRLFALSMAVHWDVGGSLASTLATVGRTIRDRIELARRARTQAVEANLSVVVVMAIAYGLGYLMWQASPERMVAFVSTEIGSGLVAIAIALQGVGLIWMTRISRSSF
jgi:tight adherence protein B